MVSTQSGSYWDDIHQEKGHDVSWWQDENALWMDLVDETGIARGSVVDIGAGTSIFLASMARRGFGPLYANDISAAALSELRKQMIEVEADTYFFPVSVTELELPEQVEIWHDRAVFHFLTEPADQAAYHRALIKNTYPGSAVIIATFSPNGPETCSGLPVQRWSPEDLVEFLGDQFTPLAKHTRVHTTPWGATQEFTIVIAKRK
jgi:SAM-dependent methyltransferase